MAIRESSITIRFGMDLSTLETAESWCGEVSVIGTKFADSCNAVLHDLV
jgi:hypothetical protein